MALPARVTRPSWALAPPQIRNGAAVQLVFESHTVFEQFTPLLLVQHTPDRKITQVCAGVAVPVAVAVGVLDGGNVRVRVLVGSGRPVKVGVMVGVLDVVSVGLCVGELVGLDVGERIPVAVGVAIGVWLLACPIGR